MSDPDDNFDYSFDLPSPTMSEIDSGEDCEDGPSDDEMPGESQEDNFESHDERVPDEFDEETLFGQAETPEENFENSQENGSSFKGARRGREDVEDVLSDDSQETGRFDVLEGEDNDEEPGDRGFNRSQEVDGEWKKRRRVTFAVDEEYFDGSEDEEVVSMNSENDVNEENLCSQEEDWADDAEEVDVDDSQDEPIFSDNVLDHGQSQESESTDRDGRDFSIFSMEVEEYASNLGHGAPTEGYEDGVASGDDGEDLDGNYNAEDEFPVDQLEEEASEADDEDLEEQAVEDEEEDFMAVADMDGEEDQEEQAVEDEEENFMAVADMDGEEEELLDGEDFSEEREGENGYNNEDDEDMEEANADEEEGGYEGDEDEDGEEEEEEVEADEQVGADAERPPDDIEVNFDKCSEIRAWLDAAKHDIAPHELLSRVTSNEDDNEGSPDEDDSSDETSSSDDETTEKNVGNEESLWDKIESEGDDGEEYSWSMRFELDQASRRQDEAKKAVKVSGNRGRPSVADEHQAPAGADGEKEPPAEEEVDWEEALREDFILFEELVGQLKNSVAKDEDDLTPELLEKSDALRAEVKVLTSFSKKQESLLETDLGLDVTSMREEITKLKKIHSLRPEVERAAENLISVIDKQDGHTSVQLDFSRAEKEAEVGNLAISLASRLKLIEVYKEYNRLLEESLPMVEEVAACEEVVCAEMVGAQHDFGYGHMVANWQLVLLGAEEELRHLAEVEAELDREQKMKEEKLADLGDNEVSAEIEALEKKLLETGIQEEEIELVIKLGKEHEGECEEMAVEGLRKAVEELIDSSAKNILLEEARGDQNEVISELEGMVEPCSDLAVEEAMEAIQSLGVNPRKISEAYQQLLEKEDTQGGGAELEEERKQLEYLLAAVNSEKAACDELVAKTNDVRKAYEELQNKVESLSSLLESTRESSPDEDFDQNPPPPPAENELQVELIARTRSEGYLNGQQMARATELSYLRQLIGESKAGVEQRLNDVEGREMFFEGRHRKLQAKIDFRKLLTEDGDVDPETFSNHKLETQGENDLLEELQFLEQCSALGLAQRELAAAEEELKTIEDSVIDQEEEEAERNASLEKRARDLDAIMVEISALESGNADLEKVIEGKLKEEVPADEVASDSEMAVEKLKADHAIVIEIAKVEKEKERVKTDLELLKARLEGNTKVLECGPEPPEKPLGAVANQSDSSDLFSGRAI